MESKLALDPRVVAEARRLAAVAAEPVIELARTHTTVSVERATLRLAGLSGADPASFSAGEGAGTQPWVNTVVDAVRDQVGLEHGVALPVWHAITSGAASFSRTYARHEPMPSHLADAVKKEAAAAR